MIYTIKNEKLCVKASTSGAQLQSICAVDGTEYLWQGDPTYWSDRAINLFPYCARFRDDKYFMDGQEYSMTIHGFAMSSEFSVFDSSDSRMTFELRSNEATKAQYPREFSYKICYELDGNQLLVHHEVENLDRKTMYFGFGGHPGFNVPLNKDLKFEDYQLRFEEGTSPIRFGFSERLLLNDQDTPYPLENDCLKLDHHLFDDDAIIAKEVGHKVVLESSKDPRRVTVSFPEMDYLGIWHMPHTDAPYVCIEPWKSLPSHEDRTAIFEEQKDLVALSAGEVYKNTWIITIE